jgi:hypothetical protein
MAAKPTWLYAALVEKNTHTTSQQQLKNNPSKKSNPTHKQPCGSTKTAAPT